MERNIVQAAHIPLAGLTVLTAFALPMPGACAQAKPAAGSKAPGTGKAPTFPYQSTPLLRKQIQDRYIASSARKSPTRAKHLAATFAKYDFDKIYQNLMANTGLKNNDAADTFTAYKIIGYTIANGIKTMPPKSQILGLRQQTANMLANNPNLGLSDPAARCEAGEKFKMLTVTFYLGLMDARQSKNPDDVKKYQDGVAALYAENGPDLRKLTLTEVGFVNRR